MATEIEKASTNHLTKKPFKLKQYEVAVAAVYLLGGTSRAVDTEDVAVKCHELAPSLFSWQKYKEHPNLELVRVSLSDAKKLKNGKLLTGSGREGWRLSSKGLDWLANKKNTGFLDVASEIRQGESKAGSIDAVRKQREHTRITSSDAWKEWSEGKSLSFRHARHVFRIDEYTTDKMLEIKISRLRAMFENDLEVSRFLEEAGHVLLKGERNA